MESLHNLLDNLEYSRMQGKLAIEAMLRYLTDKIRMLFTTDWKRMHEVSMLKKLVTESSAKKQSEQELLRTTGTKHEASL